MSRWITDLICGCFNVVLSDNIWEMNVFVAMFWFWWRPERSEKHPRLSPSFIFVPKMFPSTLSATSNSLWDVCHALLLLLTLLVWQLQTSFFWPIDLWDEWLPLVMVFWRSEWLTGSLNLNNNAAWKEWFRFRFDETSSLTLFWRQ